MSALDDLVTPAATEANRIWESWCDLDGDKLPDHEVDAVQVELVRWQRHNFGNVSPVNKMDVHMALGVIEEFGETIDAKEIGGKKGKLDGLADICVYQGQLLNGNRLAIRPVIELAEGIVDYVYGEEDRIEAWLGWEPTAAIGKLAHITLKREQRIRGYADDKVWRNALVKQCAVILAWAKLDVMAALDEDAVAQRQLGIETLDGLIAKVYVNVAYTEVLKRNWATNPVDGGNR